MTAEEANVWRLFTAKHGVSESNPRTELILANIGHLISVGANIKSPTTLKPFGADYFVPWLKDQPDDGEGFATKEEIMAYFPIKKPN